MSDALKAVGHNCLDHYQHGGLVPWTCPICEQVWTVRDGKFVKFEEVLGLRESVRLRAEAEAQRELDHHVTETLIKEPETGDFLRGALVEAAYQREAWPDQDKAKSDADWFWTLGYICGKVMKESDPMRALHHIEAGAALLANWHQAVKVRA